MKFNNVRFFILFICLISTCVTFITRTCMNIALVSMVRGPTNGTLNNRTNENGSLKYEWSESDQGLILSAFYWAYIIFQMPMGSLAERIGGKLIMCICLAGSAMVNLITPFITDYLILVILLRFILGAVQAGMFPAAFRLQVNWMPISNRSVGFACMDAGATIGSIIAFFTSGFLIELFDWPCLFYVSGTISLIILMIFALFVTSQPDQHPFVTEKELHLIKQPFKCHQVNEKAKMLKIYHTNDDEEEIANDNLNSHDDHFNDDSSLDKTKDILVPSVIVTPVMTCGESNLFSNEMKDVKNSKKINQLSSKNNDITKEVNSSDINVSSSTLNKSSTELPKLLSPCDVASYRENQSNTSHLFSLDRRMSLAISVTGEKVPWSRILTNVPVIVTGLFKFAVSWNFMVFYTKMPSFLKEVANVDITSNGVINAMNNICIAISLMTFGYLSEKFIESGWFTRTKCRKFFAIFSGFCQAIAIVSIPYMVANSNLTLLTILLFTASFCNGCQSGSDIPLPSEMTKAFPATLYALLNIIATSTGIIVPPFVAFILNTFSENRNLAWSVVFYMSSTLTIVSTIVFMIFSSAERQPFDFASIKPYYVNPIGQSCSDSNDNIDNTSTTCTINDTFHEIDLNDVVAEENKSKQYHKPSSGIIGRLNSIYLFAFNSTRMKNNWFNGN